MPTYDYICKACHHEFDAFQSITAKPLRKCPSCGAMKLQRLIGPGAGVIFKGSGFYQTDYRSESYKKDAKAEKESTAKAKDASSKDTKADKKPPATSDTTSQSKSTGTTDK